MKTTLPKNAIYLAATAISTVLGGASSWAGVLVVNPGNPTAYQQIYEAVDAASPGDTIKVHTGTYQWFQVNTDGLTIRAADDESKPVIDGALGLGVSPWIDGEEVGELLFAVNINADHVKVVGLEAENATGEENDAYGFLVTGNENKLIANTATNNTHGFGVSGFSEVRSGNVLVNNTANGNGLGFELIFANNNTLKHNRVNGFFDGDGFNDLFGSGNTFKGNEVTDSFLGYVVFESDSSELKGNSAVDSFIGVLVQFSSGTTLKENRAYGSVLDGFNLSDDSGLTLVKNEVIGAGVRDAIRMNGVVNSTFKGNMAANAGQHGFSLDQNEDYAGESFGNVFVENVATDNGEYGYFVNESSLDNNFRNNTCARNGLGGSNLEGVCEDQP